MMLTDGAGRWVLVMLVGNPITASSLRAGRQIIISCRTFFLIFIGKATEHFESFMGKAPAEFSRYG